MGNTVVYQTDLDLLTYVCKTYIRDDDVVSLEKYIRSYSNMRIFYAFPSLFVYASKLHKYKCLYFLMSEIKNYARVQSSKYKSFFFKPLDINYKLLLDKCLEISIGYGTDDQRFVEFMLDHGATLPANYQQKIIAA